MHQLCTTKAPGTLDCSGMMKPPQKSSTGMLTGRYIQCIHTQSEELPIWRGTLIPRIVLSSQSSASEMSTSSVQAKQLQLLDITGQCWWKLQPKGCYMKCCQAHGPWTSCSFLNQPTDQLHVQNVCSKGCTNWVQVKTIKVENPFLNIIGVVMKIEILKWWISW